MLRFQGNIEHAMDRMTSSIQKQPEPQIANLDTLAKPRTPYKYATIGTISSKSTNGRVLPFGMESHAQSNAIYTQPSFYSPLHTPQNWQIPNKRREVYQWLRYFYENEPKVGAGIDFYSNFSMNGFETQCSDNKIRTFLIVSIRKLI